MRITILLLLAGCALTGAPAVGEEAAEAAIRESVQRYVAAFNAGDADAAAATYTPDGSHTYALGYTHRGRAEIAGGLRELLSGPLQGARISITTLQIRFPAPTIAIEEEEFSIEGLLSPDRQPLPPVNGLCLVVHQQQDERWLAAAVQCLVPPPALPLERER